MQLPPPLLVLGFVMGLQSPASGTMPSRAGNEAED